MSDLEQRCLDWWHSDIIEMRPGEIRFRGYPIEQLIGRIGFVDMIWLMLRGELPTREQAALLEATLVGAVDHGPQAPSIAIARMAATCGVGLNNAMASALNVLGDVHGGAGEQALALYHAIAARSDALALHDAVAEELAAWRAAQGRIVPGFGHRFHPRDPRAPRLLGLVDAAAERGVVDGRFAHIAREIERQLAAEKGKPIPLNIDGATAVIHAELGFAPALARGLFCLSRAVGILAHAWEQTQQGGRNKGPMPKGWLWDYRGQPARELMEDEAARRP